MTRTPKGNAHTDPQGAGFYHHAEPLDGKTQRRKAKQDLRQGIEPQPTYVTGKAWYD